MTGIIEMLPILVLTYFEPFAGRSFNQSEAVARAVAEQPVLAQAYERISLCRVPVVYDEAEAAANRCLEEARALAHTDQKVVLVSFGEWSGDHIRIETMAHNLDDTPGLADNKGEIRQNRKIDPNGPDTIEFQFPVDTFFKTPSMKALLPKRSSDAGSFLCNHLSYQMARTHDGPFVFIHVGRDAPRAATTQPPEAMALADALKIAAQHL